MTRIVKLTILFAYVASFQRAILYMRGVHYHFDATLKIQQLIQIYSIRLFATPFYFPLVTTEVVGTEQHNPTGYCTGACVPFSRVTTLSQIVPNP